MLYWFLKRRGWSYEPLNVAVLELKKVRRESSLVPLEGMQSSQYLGFSPMEPTVRFLLLER